MTAFPGIPYPCGGLRRMLRLLTAALFLAGGVSAFGASNWSRLTPDSMESLGANFKITAEKLTEGGAKFSVVISMVKGEFGNDFSVTLSEVEDTPKSFSSRGIRSVF